MVSLHTQILVRFFTRFLDLKGIGGRNSMDLIMLKMLWQFCQLFFTRKGLFWCSLILGLFCLITSLRKVSLCNSFSFTIYFSNLSRGHLVTSLACYHGSVAAWHFDWSFGGCLTNAMSSDHHNFLLQKVSLCNSFSNLSRGCLVTSLACYRGSVTAWHFDWSFGGCLTNV